MSMKFIAVLMFVFLFEAFGVAREISLEQKKPGINGGTIRALLPISDYGISLEQKNSGINGGIVRAILQVSDKDVICGASNGIYHWSDQNKSWSKCSTFPPFLCQHLIVDDSGNIFANAVISSIGCNPLLEGFYRSNDTGVTWEKLPFPEGVVSKIIFDHKNKRLIAGNTSGIYQSTTQGNSWDTLALLGKEVADLAVDSRNRIFLASPKSGVLKSDGSNKVWKTCNTGITNIDIRCLFIDSSDNIIAGGSLGEIYSSKDTGNTWVQDTQLTGTISFFKYFTNSNSLFAGTARGVFQYSTKDNNWKLVSTASPFDELSYSCMVENGSKGFLFGTEFSGIVAESKSEPVWYYQNEGLNNSSILCMKEAPNKELLVGTAGMGIYRSSNDGETWVPSSTGWVSQNCHSLTVSSKGIIYGGTGNLGVCYSTDNGNSWKQIDNVGYNLVRVYSIAVNSHEHLYVCPSEKFARNLGDGNGWEQINLFSDTTLNWLSTAVAINADDHIFVATYPFNLFRSIDNGITWKSIFTGLPEAVIRTIFILPDGKIYLAVEHGGVFSSSDNGDTWHNLNKNLPDTMVSQVWCDKYENLYAGTPSGLYYFNIADSSWSKARGCTWWSWVRALYQNSKGYLFVGTEGDGIFRSKQQMTAIEKKEMIENNDKPLIDKNSITRFQKDAFFRFNLPSAERVKITVINSLGEEVGIIADEYFSQGSHFISINKSKNFNEGVYFICMRLKSKVYISKFVHLR